LTILFQGSILGLPHATGFLGMFMLADGTDNGGIGSSTSGDGAHGRCRGRSSGTAT
jgi:hypothetical protein